MRLTDLLYVLKKRSDQKILVTGPQRSGTTIAAKIIAHELQLDFFPEESIETDNLQLLQMQFLNRDNAVIQAPALCYRCHDMYRFLDAVIFMMRNDEDIRKSAEKINWTTEFDYTEGLKYGIFGTHSWLVKKDFWPWQKEQLQNSILKDCDILATELQYESMSDHPMWVPKEERENFNSRQTER
jgi:hypothetical protein